MLSDIEFAILDENFKYHTEQKNIKPDLVVYLRVDPEICHQRVKERFRPEESEMQLVN